jgi:hypothetical protein
MIMDAAGGEARLRRVPQTRPQAGSSSCSPAGRTSPIYLTKPTALSKSTALA